MREREEEHPRPSGRARAPRESRRRSPLDRRAPPGSRRAATIRAPPTTGFRDSRLAASAASSQSLQPSREPRQVVEQLGARPRLHEQPFPRARVPRRTAPPARSTDRARNGPRPPSARRPAGSCKSTRPPSHAPSAPTPAHTGEAPPGCPLSTSVSGESDRPRAASRAIRMRMPPRQDGSNPTSSTSPTHRSNGRTPLQPGQGQHGETEEHQDHPAGSTADSFHSAVLPDRMLRDAQISMSLAV